MTDMCDPTNDALTTLHGAQRAGGGQPPMPRLRAAAAEGAAMPLEAGDSTVGVAVEGRVELLGK